MEICVLVLQKDSQIKISKTTNNKAWKKQAYESDLNWYEQIWNYFWEKKSI